jgi:hypothetical protein
VRSISASFRQSVESRFQQDVDLVFITINHPLLDPPLRFVSDTIDYSWDGEDWTAFPFDIQLMSDDDSAPRAQLEIQNVDSRIGEGIRSLTTPPRLRIDLLSSADFDLTVRPRMPISVPFVEYTADKLFLINVKIDPMVVTADIVGWDFGQRSWPGIRATKNRLPGVYR